MSMTKEEIKNQVNNYQQIILVGESFGMSDVHWDTRSIEDNIRLLTSALKYFQNLQKGKQDAFDLMIGDTYSPYPNYL